MTRLLAIAMAALALLAIGCGSSSNDKPAVCGDVDATKSAIADLTSKDTLTGGAAAIQTASQKALDSAKKLATDAGSQFSSETAAVNASVDALQATIKQLGSSSTRTAAIAQLPADALAVKNATERLLKAVQSTCD